LEWVLSVTKREFRDTQNPFGRRRAYSELDELDVLEDEAGFSRESVR
jgi:hypothetical protein